MEPTISAYPLLTLASGDTLSLQQYQFQGSLPGLTVYVQANLHGAELAGNAVIQRLIDHLRSLSALQLRGSLRLVPLCNPMGVNSRAHHFSSGRFNPYDGRDWNRIFWDYEQAHQAAQSFAAAHQHDAEVAVLQQQYREHLLSAFATEIAALTTAADTPVHRRYRTRLQHLALDADIVIDLHTSANQGLVYLYYFRNRAAAVPYFGVDFGLLLDCYDGNAFDEAWITPWLALEDAFQELGRSLHFDREAWTMELGSSLKIDAIAVDRGVAGILNYLRHRGVLTDQPPVALPAVPLSRTSQLTRYYAPTGGLIRDRVALGTWVQAGDWLFDLLSFPKDGRLPTWESIAAQQPGQVYDLSWNQSVNEGEYVLAVMTPDY